jgi:hypothetical protein
MIAVAAILPLEVGEIGVGDIEPLRQHPRDQNGHRRLLAQKRGGIVDFVNHRPRRGAHRRGVRLVQKNRHFSEHRAGLGDGGDDGIALDHLEPSLDQHIEVAGGMILVKDEASRGNVSPNSPAAIVQNLAHASTPPC